MNILEFPEEAEGGGDELRHLPGGIQEQPPRETAERNPQVPYGSEWSIYL